MNNTNLTGQLPLEFILSHIWEKEDFMVAACNHEAFALVDSGLPGRFCHLHLRTGRPRKTHLATMFAHNVANLANWPYKVPVVRAKDIRFETLQLFEKCSCLIVEELSENVDNEALFHLYNHYRNEGGYILFTAAQAPARTRFTLPDLQSRMNIVPSVAINEPDDEMLSALILKLFTDRQIMVAPEIINYILLNMQRSFAYARKLVAEIDSISLARKRAVSLAIVKEAFSVLNDNHQGDLFS